MTSADRCQNTCCIAVSRTSFLGATLECVISSSLEDRRRDRWGGYDVTMFCEFTPQYVVSWWPEVREGVASHLEQVILQRRMV